MHRRDAIAEGILHSRAHVLRYLAGFDDTTHTRQAPNLPNHAAWCLGHLALTMHRASEKFDGVPPPAADFAARAEGAGRARQSGRFELESVSFGSKPSDDPSGYPALARAVEIFSSACERMAGAVRAADDATLDREVPWGGASLPLWALAQRMIFHNGDHTGQLSYLRRALGFASVFA